MAKAPGGRPVAALTGATGFLGARLVQALDAAGFAVRALARRDPNPPGWGAVAPEIVRGDLSDTQALAALTTDAAVIVHVAGAIKAADRAGFMAVNRDGARRLAERVGEARLILVSSLAARHPEVSSYAESKRAGEAVAAEIVPPERLTVVRPPAIYGPGDRETLAIFKAAARSPVLPVLSRKARLALVHVDDAAETIAALAQDWRPGTYALSDRRPEGYGWSEILAAAAGAVGTRPIRAVAPDWLLPGIARLGAAAGLMSREKVGEILHEDWSVPREELAPGALQARWSLDDGFRNAVSWYRGAGWLR